jgi:NAD(P)-dependent dehydrogenase (short-subunit alcohol dehydrogenase family)
MPGGREAGLARRETAVAEVAQDTLPEIRCNVICPGGVETPMSAVHIARFGDPDEAIRLTTGRQLPKRFTDPVEVTDVVVFLECESSFMTAAVVPVEAGHSAW